jgi:hypothetical protein
MEELTKTNKTNKIDYTITPISFYKFVCEDENIVSTYVGHTANFTRRKSGHKSSCNNDNGKDYNLKIYQTIRENGGWDNWKMIEIKSQLCENKRHAERIEQELIDQYKSELNSQKAFCDSIRRDYFKKYLLNNRNEILEKQKQYYLDNKVKKVEYQQKNKQHIAEIKKKAYLKRKAEKEEAKLKELV